MLDRELPLDDDMRTLQRYEGVRQQMREDHPGAGERQVGDHRKRLYRKRLLEGVSLQDRHFFMLPRRSAKPTSETRVTLDHNNLGPCLHERPGDNPGASAYLQNEVAIAELRVSHQAGR